MTYRIDVQDREGRAFIERMFAQCDDQEYHALYGVALSGGKALERDAPENNLWLYVVDCDLLAKSICTRSNYGAWRDGVSEGGLLCLLHRVDGLAFEGVYRNLAQDLGDKSEEAVLRITCEFGDCFVADLYHKDGTKSRLYSWEGGE